MEYNLLSNIAIFVGLCMPPAIYISYTAKKLLSHYHNSQYPKKSITSKSKKRKPENIKKCHHYLCNHTFIAIDDLDIFNQYCSQHTCLVPNCFRPQYWESSQCQAHQPHAFTSCPPY